METSNLTTSIIETINSIFETLFSSIDTTIYSVLDELTFIDKNILNNSVFQKIFGCKSKCNPTIAFSLTNLSVAFTRTNAGVGFIQCHDAGVKSIGNF